MEAKVTAAGTEWRARKACFCRAGCSSLRSRALGEALTQHCVGHFAQRMLPIQRGVPDVELHMPGRNVSLEHIGRAHERRLLAEAV